MLIQKLVMVIMQLIEYFMKNDILYFWKDIGLMI